ncbi:hypothetical protein L9F63_020911, partial [Diploptera punctata]
KGMYGSKTGELNGERNTQQKWRRRNASKKKAEGLADGDGSDRDDDDLGIRAGSNAAKRLRRELQEEELARHVAEESGSSVYSKCSDH